MSELTLGQAIDQLYEARAARLAKDKEVKDLKAAEVAAKVQVLELLKMSGLEKASGKLATAGITSEDIPYVRNWDEVFDYIKENNRFDLVQRRIGVVAWRDLYRDSILVPGTEAAVDIDISLTKARRS